VSVAINSPYKHLNIDATAARKAAARHVDLFKPWSLSLHAGISGALSRKAQSMNLLFLTKRIFGLQGYTTLVFAFTFINNERTRVSPKISLAYRPAPRL
jgi:hypothetical protein